MWGEIINFFNSLTEPKINKYKVTVYKTEILEEIEIEATSRNEALEIADEKYFGIDNVILGAILIDSEGEDDWETIKD